MRGEERRGKPAVVRGGPDLVRGRLDPLLVRQNAAAAAAAAAAGLGLGIKALKIGHSGGVLVHGSVSSASRTRRWCCVHLGERIAS